MAEVTRPMEPRPQKDLRALSLPNVLTYGRIAAVPALVLCFYIEGYVGRWLALIIFIAASVTDYLDGYLARVWQQTSPLGRL
ncbi:MAG: CDP-alcohol phosphatidyltransferase family protein, partial [Bauldia sp.]